METQSMDQDSSSYDTSSFTERSPQSSNTSTIPPRGDEIDRWQRHISMQTFGQDLQRAAISIYPNRRRSSYTEVYVLILKWKTEDPKLPVSIEIAELCKVLDEIYHYHIEIFEIPDHKSHATVSKKINAFVDINGDSKSDLKIVYYAGHSKLSKTRDLVWSSWQDKENQKCSTVTWTGIQHALEQAESDVLILLDSCESGVGDAGEGNGVTELMAACAFDVQANGVGHYSFTNALTIELRLLSQKLSFPVVELYTQVYCRSQHHMARGVNNERYPAPIHLQLTRDDQFPRSIQLSIQEPSRGSSLENSEKTQKSSQSSKPSNGNRKRAWDESSEMLSSKRPCHSNEQLLPEENFATDTEVQNAPQGDATSCIPPTSKNCEQVHLTDAASLVPWSGPPMGQDTIALDILPHQHSKGKDGPILLLSIRLDEDVRAEDLSTKYFAEWLRAVPTIAENVSVEGAFRCDSTLIILALPFALWPYLSSHPAVVPLGLVKSSNMLQAQPTYKSAVTGASMKPPILNLEECRKRQGYIKPVDMSEPANFSAYSQMILFRSNKSQAELVFHPKSVEEQVYLQNLARSQQLDCTAKSLRVCRPTFPVAQDFPVVFESPNVEPQSFEENVTVSPTKIADWTNGRLPADKTQTPLKSASSMDWELDSTYISDDDMDFSTSRFSRSSSLSTAPSEVSQKMLSKATSVEGKAYGKTSSGYEESIFDASLSTSSTQGFTISASKTSSARRGQLKHLARSSLRAVKSIGACWRCKFLRKSCDTEEPCSTCRPQKFKGNWSDIGCKRGSLKSNMASLQLCPKSQKRDTYNSKALSQEVSSDIPENKWLQQHIEERERALKVLAASGNYDWPPSVGTPLIRQCLSISTYSPTPSGAPASLSYLSGSIVQILWEISWHSWDDYIVKSEWSHNNLAVLLVSAAHHQSMFFSDRLITLSILCLRSAIEAVVVRKRIGIMERHHHNCHAIGCSIECISNLNIHVEQYLDELSRGFFRNKKISEKNRWWLSTFYSFCIQSIVRRALIELNDASEDTNSTIPNPLACREYLHLPMRVFIAISGSYDPLAKENVDPDYTAVNIAIGKYSWASKGISGFSEYLRKLFEDDGGLLQEGFPDRQVDTISQFEGLSDPSKLLPNSKVSDVNVGSG